MITSMQWRIQDFEKGGGNNLIDYLHKYKIINVILRQGIDKNHSSRIAICI